MIQEFSRQVVDIKDRPIPSLLNTQYTNQQQVHYNKPRESSIYKKCNIM